MGIKPARMRKLQPQNKPDLKETKKDWPDMKLQVYPILGCASVPWLYKKTSILYLNARDT